MAEENKKQDSKVEKNKNVETTEEEYIDDVKEVKKGKDNIKIVLEREYIVPLRKEFKKVPEYRRARRAVKALMNFIAKHMKVEERDIRNVKIDKYLNEEIWFRGIRKPPAKIKVKAIKDSEGIVRVELVDIPDVVKFKIAREKREKDKVKKVEKKVEKKKEEKTDEEKKDEKEKTEAGAEEAMKQAKSQAKEMKHETKMDVKQPKRPVRQALQK